MTNQIIKSTHPNNVFINKSSTISPANDYTNVSHYTLECTFLKQIVAKVFNMSLEQLNSHNRLTADVAFARQVAMYLANVRLGLSFVEVGYAFGRDRSTVSHACQLIEDRRDDPKLDFTLDCLERSIDEWRALQSNMVIGNRKIGQFK